jgi:hypothetical protein
MTSLRLYLLLLFCVPTFGRQKVNSFRSVSSATLLVSAFKDNGTRIVFTGVSSAKVIADPGESKRCVALGGSDHNDGPNDLNMDPDCRVDPNEYLREELSSEEDVTEVVAVE